MPRSKADLRRQFRHARLQISPPERAALSARIASHLLHWIQSLGAKPKILALYLASPHEADLDALVEPLQHLGIQVAAPGQAGFALVDASSTCGAPSGSWRHASGQAVDVGDLDVILVPGVAFGRDGSRLGQGQGWFDRALAGSRAITVGVAFGCQIVDSVPMEEHDVPVGWIVSEDGIVSASPGAVS